MSVNLLFRTHYTDLCPRALAPLSPTHARDHVETLINVRVARAGLTVTEVPSIEYERLHHGERKLNALRDGLRVLRVSSLSVFAAPEPQEDGWLPAFHELAADDPDAVEGQGPMGAGVAATLTAADNRPGHDRSSLEPLRASVLPANEQGIYSTMCRRWYC